MSFEINGKVALISGGASGIGLKHAKELLKNGSKGVTLADVNPNLGKQALQEIEKEFGPNKAIYIQTDVTNINSYERAFEKTIEVFKNLDILVNNAGILNDGEWEKEIDVNIKGVIHGLLLGLEKYIPKYRSGPEGVIVNIASLAGIEPYGMMPIYTGTKFAITGMSKAFGSEEHYKITKVKVLALCPGPTETPLLTEMSGERLLGPRYAEIFQNYISNMTAQPADVVAPALVKIIKDGRSGSVWFIDGGKGPYEFVLPPVESFVRE